MEETLNPRRVGSTYDGAEHKRRRELYLKQDLARGKQKRGTPPTLTHLNTSRSNILMEIKDMKEFKWPPRLRSPPETRDKNKYCDYHRDHGHTTEDCITLQREIEALIKRGFLKEYIRHDKHLRNDRNNGKTTESGGGSQPTAGTINLIIGGIASREDSNSGHKQYAQRHNSIQMTAPNDMKDITFGSKDLEDISYPHDDALVISAIITNFEVRRVLVDNGSAANVLSQEAFMKMGISVNQFKTVKTLLQGFGGGIIIPEGIVDLPLTLGSGQKQVTEFTPFHVVHASMAYSAIIGRPLLNKIRAIVSTFHLVMKFPISDGIGIVRGDQKVARQCYVTCVRGMSTDVMQISTPELELENQQKFVPGEELIEVGVEHSED
ncbi:uncharacterized protein LOC111368977 [Olea europaea var. sylvestris]|uniref:uncharacterized protein LOC111368977 n=1 Tax=Olea europaea var. sylvestris TaxID=158386 RepID=UPI000C1CFCF8|nr:uncharacterized protein LOC111368977 [Olea europaea var. sylvestris]